MEKRYQVFVSSTFRDLIDARLRVLEIILLLKHIPAGMEYFPSANARAWEVIKKIIDTSDYFVLIVGGRYGSLDADGIGFTEKEYDYAQSKQKHVLAFVHGNPGQLPLDESETDPALRERLDLFLTKVRRDHTIAKWTETDDLAVQVIAALANAILDSPSTGWVRADDPEIAALLIRAEESRNESEERPRVSDREQVRVSIGFNTAGGGSLYADIYNSGSVPAFVTEVALVRTTIAPTTPIGDSSFKVEFHPEKGAKRADEKSIDIPPKKQVRFELGIKVAPIAQQFLDVDPKQVALTVSTFGGEIHRVAGERVQSVLAQVAAIWKVVQEAATPKHITILFYQGGPGLISEAGSMRIITFKRIEDGEHVVGIDSVSPGLSLTEKDRVQIAAQVLEGRVLGAQGEYKWRVD